MRTIEINITKARLESFSISFPKEGTPDIEATLWLYAANDKRISQYSIGTKSWSDNRIEFPPELHTYISNTMEILEHIAHRECNGEMWMIESSKQRKQRESEGSYYTNSISIEDLPF